MRRLGRGSELSCLCRPEPLLKPVMRKVMTLLITALIWSQDRCYLAADTACFTASLHHGLSPSKTQHKVGLPLCPFTAAFNATAVLNPTCTVIKLYSDAGSCEVFLSRL